MLSNCRCLGLYTLYLRTLASFGVFCSRSCLGDVGSFTVVVVAMRVVVVVVVVVVGWCCCWSYPRAELLPAGMVWMYGCDGRIAGFRGIRASSGDKRPRRLFGPASQ